MKLFRCRERLLYRSHFPLIERADTPKRKFVFMPLAKMGEQKEKGWLRRFLEKCFSRERHKIDQ